MKGLARLTGGVYAAATALVAGVVLLCADATDYYMKTFTRKPLAGNAALFFVGLALVAAAALWLRSARAERLERALARLGARGALLASALVFAMQAFVAYCASFASLWDARDVLISAYAYALDLPEYIEQGYFSVYPNNAALAFLYGALLRAPMALFGVEPGLDRCVQLLTLLQCALNACAGALVWDLTRALAARLRLRAHLCAWTAYLGYFALVGCSPWVLVVYSDSAALLAPVLLLWLYVRAERRGRAGQALLMALTGAVGAAAFLIKPQASIPLIAVLILELWRLLFARGERGRAALRLAPALVSAIIVLVPMRGAILRAVGVEPDGPRAVNAAHYLNMGLCDWTDGAFNGHDLDAALAVEDPAERTRWCLASARARAEAMGPAGLLDHALRKALTNFADGGFAYGVDFAREPTPPRNAVAAAVRSVVYDDGAAYPYLLTLQQLVWLLALAALPFTALCLRGGEGARCGALTAAMLSAVGIVLFNMLFEAKARYLYVMAPVLLSLAALGAAQLARGLRALVSKGRGGAPAK